MVFLPRCGRAGATWPRPGNKKPRIFFDPGLVVSVQKMASMVSEFQPEQERDTHDGHGASGQNKEQSVEDADSVGGFVTIHGFLHKALLLPLVFPLQEK